MLHESVKLFKINGDYNKQVKQGLDNLIDTITKNKHEIKGVYTNSDTYISVNEFCGHGFFKIRPYNYLIGKGCPKCGATTKKAKSRLKRNINSFPSLVESNGHKLLSPYISGKEKVLIDFKCGHEPTLVRASKYKYRKSGCRECQYINNSINQSEPSRIEFKATVKANGHILLSEYGQNQYEKVLIDFRCGHEPYLISPSVYKQRKDGQGCPICNNSYGVVAVCDWLDSMLIEYKCEHLLPNKRWRYDIYIPSHNLIVEVHGKQHYEEVSFFSARTLKQEQANDRNKKRYAEKLGHNYLIVDYREHEPDLALQRFLNQFENIQMVLF